MTNPRTPPVTALSDDPEYRAGVLDFLGLLAYGELMAFERMAADSALAPTITDKAALAAHAAAEERHFERLRARIVELGEQPEQVMAPFVRPLEEFHAQTTPSDWLESIVKAYVGDAIAADFYKESAAYLDEQTRDLILDVVGDTGFDDYAVARVRAAVAAEPRIAGRLALWARTVVGQALSDAQRVLAEGPALSRLFEGAAGGEAIDLNAIGAMLTRVIDAHSARMAKIALDA